MDNHCQTLQREITAKVRKAEVLFLYAIHRLVLFYISTKYHKNIPKGLWLTEQTRNQWIITVKYNKENNTKSKKDRVVILVRDTSSYPVLHFCQVPLKYSKGYSSYRANTKSFSNKTKGNNSKSKKGRVNILVRNTSSGPVLHFYQVSSKYSKGYSSYRADKKFYADTNAKGIHPKNNMYPPPLWWGRGGVVGGGGGWT